MKNWYDRNVFVIDRVVRYLMGGSILLGVLMDLLNVWFSLAPIYLINTAILRWDPVYWLLTHLTKAAQVKAVKSRAPQGQLESK
jgi:hypothetical protein